MLDLRKRIFVGIGITAGLILAFVLLYLFVLKADDTVDNNIKVDDNGNVINIIDNQPVTIKQPINDVVTKPNPPINQEEMYAMQVARMFVEKYGSYSNQNDNQHIKDMSYLTTKSMQDWLETKALQQQKEYSGMTTKVISSRIKTIDTTSAVVEIDSQQQIYSPEGQKLEQRSGRVELIRMGEEWKVDGFYWE